jgi:hypothetical protein
MKQLLKQHDAHIKAVLYAAHELQWRVAMYRHNTHGMACKCETCGTLVDLHKCYDDIESFIAEHPGGQVYCENCADIPPEGE